MCLTGISRYPANVPCLAPRTLPCARAGAPGGAHGLRGPTPAAALAIAPARAPGPFPEARKTRATKGFRTEECMNPVVPSSLDSHTLARCLCELVGDERSIQVEFLLHLDEFDRRRAYLEAGFGSLWEYCLRSLHLREGAAGRRIGAMKVLRRFPKLEAALRDGRVCLSTVSLLGPILTDANRSSRALRTGRRPRSSTSSRRSSRGLLRERGFADCLRPLRRRAARRPAPRERLLRRPHLGSPRLRWPPRSRLRRRRLTRNRGARSRSPSRHALVAGSRSTPRAGRSSRR